MEINFCRRCGAELTSTDGHVYKCKNNHTIYLNSAPTAGVIFVSKDGIATLAVRAHDPHKGALDMIGGFVDGNETIEDALEREILEEIGLTKDQYEKPVYVGSSADKYQFGGEYTPIVTMMYWSRLESGAEPTPNDDVASIVTRPILDIDPEELGGEDVKNGLRTIQKLFSEGKI